MRLTGAFGLVFLLVMFLAGPAISQANSGFAPIEIRLAAQAAGSGPRLVVEGSGQTLEVEPRTLLGPVDFTSVGQVEWVEGKPGFNVVLTPAGAQKYEQISTKNVGRSLAIIAGGKILMTPKILDPVRAQGFLLTVNTEAEATQLAEKIRQAVNRSKTGG
ncbi:MAG: SecDF P1 head subdomain-containing protein [Mesorhizobium sp.]